MVNLATQKIITLAEPGGRKSYGVVSFKWHPTKPNILAFGTKEGRVAFMDVDTGNITPVKEKQKVSVEDMEWYQGEEYVLTAFVDRTMKVYSLESPNVA